MGCHKNITAEKFPTQLNYPLWRRTKVCFHYNTDKEFYGTIVRADAEEPYELLILLDDGRVVNGKECQYSPFEEFDTGWVSLFGKFAFNFKEVGNLNDYNA